jgi:hypothetical protein
MRFHRLRFTLRLVAAEPGDNDDSTVSPESMTARLPITAVISGILSIPVTVTLF